MASFNREASERKDYARKINRAFTRLSTGCSERTVKAMSLPSLREKREQEAAEAGSCMLPEVAIYRAGHRTVRKDATHIIK
ncbi:hypothetical protein HQN64_20495 [Enterobacteriaceae bacterium BIT-l23]|nr:hypothetical protein [Enterobacteriaceae bacterium BIT-l23]